MRSSAILRLAGLALVLSSLCSLLCAQDTAWAWVDPLGQGASFPANSNYSYSSHGGAVIVDRVPGTSHRFIVRFPGFTDGTGVVLASGYGGNHTPVVTSWNITSGELRADVSVFGAAGAPANDKAFTISYRVRGGGRNAFLWANLASSASYTPTTIYSYNGSRPSPTIARLGVGRYLVKLPGLNAPFANGGNVLVTPYGTAARRAKVEGWSVVGSDTEVVVRTSTMAGQLTDTRFTFSYNEYAALISDFEGGGAHVWADDPFAASYTPDPLYTDSKGHEGPQNAERIHRLGIGRYEVLLPNVAPLGSTLAHVSGYGFDDSYATIEEWLDDGCGGTRVFVRTYSATGVATDARFLLNYVTNRPWQRRETAWAWVYPPGQGSSWVPDPDYQYNSSGLQVTVNRDPGQSNRFRVNFPGFGSASGCVHATAYGGNHTAVVNSWSRVGTTIQAWVELFTQSGTPANDAAFTVRWRGLGNDSNREAYLFANSANATNYTPDPFYSWNAKRADPTIQRTGTGIYTVYLPGLGQSNVGGHVQVTPYGPNLLRAKVWSWSPNGNDMAATIRISDANGQLVNGLFVMSYNEVAAPIGVPFGSGGHLWASDPQLASYTPNSFYSDSNGIEGPAGQEQITRANPGVYQVHLPNLSPVDGSFAQVTAYGGDGHYAAVGGWSSDGSGGTNVTVHTYAANGVPADSRFNLLYLTGKPARPVGQASNQNYGSGCNGLTINANTLPLLCYDWELDVDNFPAGTLFGFVLLDLSQNSASLGGLAPGCSVYTGNAVTSVFIDLFSPTDYTLSIPHNPVFLGTEVFAQGGAWVPGINAINIALSNGVRGTVGNQ